MVTRHKSSILSVVKKFDLFGPPELLEGEDPAAFAALHDRVYAALAPVNIIEDIFAHDFLLSEWENRRWRRHMSHQMNACAHHALQYVLSKHLDYDAYRQESEQALEDILNQYLPEEEAELLAHQWAVSETKAVDKVYELLTTHGWTWIASSMRPKARRRKRSH
jgi:hypothetical protein